MLMVSAQMRIFVASDPIDFRCGIDTLAQRCRTKLNAEPMSGAVFVFRNRSSTAVKVLSYDGQGFWLCHKRFSQGRLKWWPRDCSGCTSLAARELHVLLSNGNPAQATMAEDWRAVA